MTRALPPVILVPQQLGILGVLVMLAAQAPLGLGLAAAITNGRVAVGGEVGVGEQASPLTTALSALRC